MKCRNLTLLAHRTTTTTPKRRHKRSRNSHIQIERGFSPAYKSSVDFLPLWAFKCALNGRKSTLIFSAGDNPRSTTRRRSRQAKRSTYRPRGSRTLPYRARCRARFRHSAGYRYRESPRGRPWRTSCRGLDQSQRHRPACARDGSGTSPAGPRSSRGYADACHAARRAVCSRPQP